MEKTLAEVVGEKKRLVSRDRIRSQFVRYETQIHVAGSEIMRYETQIHVAGSEIVRCETQIRLAGSEFVRYETQFHVMERV